MVRAPCCEKMGLKKGPWSPEEDQILVSYIQKHGHGNWRALPKQAGLLRCGKSCRLRWTNYLRPDIKRGNFSKEEEENIIQLHEMLGNRWSAIAARLPGRTDNEIKNVWHTHLKKKLKNYQSPQETKRHSTISNSKSAPQVLESLNFCASSDPNAVASPQQCSSELSSVTDLSTEKMVPTNAEIDYSSIYFPQIDKSFWSAEVVTDDTNILNLQIEEGIKEEIQFQFPLDGKQSLEKDARLDDSMDFWYNLFMRAGDVPELPEF